MEFNQSLQNASKYTWEEISFRTRALFYLLSPEETFFEHADEVPNITNRASEVFFVLVFVEQLIFLLKDGKFNGKLSDAISSMSAGIILLFPNFFMKKVSFICYEYVFENYMVYELPWNSNWTYVFMMLFVDLMYYWNHRAAHGN